MKKKDALHTFSIVGYDPQTEEWGIAVASKFLAAGALVPWIKAGVGAVATQSLVNTDYGIKGLELMAKGFSAKEVLEQLISEDEYHSVRQVGIIDAKGSSVTYTGKDCLDWAGGFAGKYFAIQGNILTGENVIQAMADAFQYTKGTLSERLLSSLLAGEVAGGDKRGKQAAALIVVKEGAGYGGKIDKYIDIRVDDHNDPINELIRLHHLHALYFQKTKKEDVLKIEGELQKKIIQNLIKLGYLTEETKMEDVIVFEKLKDFQLIENFDERIQEPGFIDRVVIEFMEQQVSKVVYR